VAKPKWRVRISDEALLDFANILRWTTKKFGAGQARLYRNTLVATVGELGKGPDLPGVKLRDDILPGLRILHVARHGRRGRHFVIYRVAGDRIIEIARILHDQMDLQRHVPARRRDENA
jgi:toxin ParE1/3/4